MWAGRWLAAVMAMLGGFCQGALSWGGCERTLFLWPLEFSCGIPAAGESLKPVAFHLAVSVGEKHASPVWEGVEGGHEF